MKLAWALRCVFIVSWAGAACWFGWWWVVQGRPVVAAVGALLVVFAHAPVMAAECILLRAVQDGGTCAPTPTAWRLCQAWAAEVVAVLAVFGWRMAFRSNRYANRLHGRGGRGVILIHGFICNRGVFNPWQERLAACDVPCIAVNLEPLFCSIGDYAATIDNAVQRMFNATARAPVVVAHSMGGLAVRSWLCGLGNEHRIHHVITIGTPHRGTWLARFALARNAREMRWGGVWCRQLAAAEPATRYSRFTCFFGHCDNVVFPCSTSTLPGADNRHLPATAHVHMLQHPQVLAEVLRRSRE